MATNDRAREGTAGPEKVGVYTTGASAAGGTAADTGADMASTRTVAGERTDGSYYAAQSSASPTRWAVPVIAAVVIILALIWLL